MERINLTKFGFVRSPQDDFSDDGSRFTCYRRPGVEKVRISKLVSGGYGLFWRTDFSITCRN